MFRNECEKCEEFVSYTTRDRIKSDMKNRLFEQCLDNVNPETRVEVRENMDRLSRAEELRQYLIKRNVGLDSLDANFIGEGIEWADANPSDETIMRILNCIGYEERSWIEFVRKELEKRK